ncbi:hypothetical protein I3842_03G085000 [Carya illinoinensis]|uniref:Uncharacterized protein n=1 Tax=Carya illinoinensis TaxID=32201 RepID=A0A922FIL6_CARIL|nr:hypothetical protein I3842_03G085000 [Carya illinoinensis]
MDWLGVSDSFSVFMCYDFLGILNWSIADSFAILIGCLDFMMFSAPYLKLSSVMSIVVFMQDTNFGEDAKILLSLQQVTKMLSILLLNSSMFHDVTSFSFFYCYYFFY